MRQRVLIAPSPSTSAKTRLVLPASMASSMARPIVQCGCSQLDIPRANEVECAVVATQTQRAVGLNAVKAAGDYLIGTGVDGELGAKRMGARQPGPRNQAW